MKELKDMTLDELSILYHQQKRVNEEIMYLQDYLVNVSGVRIDEELKQAPENHVLELSADEKTRILNKLEEQLDTKQRKNPLSHDIQKLSSEKTANEKILGIFFRNVPMGSSLTSTSGETISQYMLMEGKRRKNLIDNLHLQKESFRKKLQKTERALNENGGETEGSGGGGRGGGGKTLMDYNQLCIENGEYQRMIRDLNHQVTRGKSETSQLITKLNSLKEQIQISSKKYADTQESFETKKRVEDKLNKESDEIGENIKLLKQELRELKEKMDEYEAPEVFEYVQCCQLIKQVEKQKRAHQHKLKLISMERHK